MEITTEKEMGGVLNAMEIAIRACAGVTVEVTKETGIELMHKANESTMRNERSSKQGLVSAYKGEHSTIRTQMFYIRLTAIPTFVSVHTVRHKIWMEHFVGSNREDLGGDAEAGRYTPINHDIWCNAQSLIGMAQARLCDKASLETQMVMQMIIDGIKEVDPALAKFLVPRCVYRNGICGEPRGCGKQKLKKLQYSSYLDMFKPKGTASPVRDKAQDMVEAILALDPTLEGLDRHLKFLGIK